MLDDPVLIKSITLPAKGSFLTESITEQRDLVKALEKYRETDLVSGNLSDLSKLKSIREDYSNSLVGSGAVFALVPRVERDYKIQADESTETLSVTLTQQPYLLYVCSDMKLGKDHYDKCKPSLADYKTSLGFHDILSLSADDFTLEVPSDIIEAKAKNIESVYFVSFELPQNALSNVTSYYSYKSENKGNGINVTDWQYSHNETAYMIFDSAALKSLSGRTVTGNFHGVAFIDKVSGEVLASNMK